VIDGEPVSDFATACFGARAADLAGLAAVVADPVLARPWGSGAQNLFLWGSRNIRFTSSDIS
jgi:hypothetical protein